MKPNVAIARAQTVADQWKADAERRRRMSKHDIGADILEHCADELLSELKDIEDANREVSAAEYAAANNKSVSTVRRWCRLGMIAARQSGRDWLIRLGEPAPVLKAKVA